MPPLAARLRGAGEEVRVLPEDAVVLLVDADGVLDGLGGAQVVGDDGVEVGDVAEAVAAQLQRVGAAGEHVLAVVEVVLPEPHGRRVGVRHHHLGHGRPVDDRPPVERDLVQRDALALVEPDPQVPLAPPHPVALDRERPALGLGDLDRLEGVERRALHLGVVEVARRLRRHRQRLGVDDPVHRARGEVDVGDEPVDRVRPAVVLLVLLDEAERAQDPAARLVGVVVDARRQRRRPHRRRVDPALLQRGQPARVGVQDLLDDHELRVDDRRLALGGRVELARRDDLAVRRGDDRVPGAPAGEVEQGHAEAPVDDVAVAEPEHLGLRRLLGEEEREPDGVAEEACLSQRRADPFHLLGRGHGERVLGPDVGEGHDGCLQEGGGLLRR